MYLLSINWDNIDMKLYCLCCELLHCCVKGKGEISKDGICIVLYLPEYKNLVYEMIPPSQFSIFGKIRLQNVFNLVHNCKATSQFLDGEQEKDSCLISG
jgi:hypothetical protein